MLSSILVLLILFLVYASYYIGSGVYVKAICKPDTPGVVLTFDDGVDEIQTPKVLDVLKKYDAKAIFFIIGEKAEKHPHLVQRIVAEGHKIGIHSYTHKPIFPILAYDNMHKEVWDTKEILEKITGEIVDLFRPPFGVTNPNVGKVVEELNLKTIGWNIRSLDTNMSQDRLQVAERVSQKLTGRDIILLHDDRQGSEILLEALLKNIEKSGHKVTLL
ncbi:MAG: polysaccharide deacetylase family protein [Paludibacteraceae bacterium]|nr:polysaccharide deacetylase family protein [Paludibacteraceae bacterium]